MTEMHEEAIRDIIAKHARLPGDVSKLTADCNLYDQGLTSLTTVHLMLSLEDHFNVEFPDRMLTRKVFQSIRSLSDAIEELKH
jgi:acyl carrier protein